MHFETIHFTLKSFFQFETIQEYNIENTDCENFGIELQNLKNKANYVVEASYRHPTSRHDNFIDAVISSIDEVAKSNQTFYLSGDFNINTVPKKTNFSSNKLINVLLSNNSHPLITTSTRIANNSHTITDNIIANDPKLLYPGVIQTAVSDQYLVFFLTLNSSISKSNLEKLFRRDKSTFNPEVFCVELESNLQLLSIIC